MNNTESTHTKPVTTDDPVLLSRRQFFSRLSIMLSGLFAALLGVPVLGFLLAPLLRRAPEIWQPVGAIDDFEVGRTVQVVFLDSSPLPWAGVAANTSAWLRRDSQQEFVAFSVNCTHLGCPIRWLSDARIFMCPCHGGVFYQDGSVAAGPPPHPLTRYRVRVHEGQVQILAQPTGQIAG